MSLDKLTKNLSYFIGDDIGLIIGAGVAFILLVTFLIYRALSGRQAKKSARRAPPAILTSDETAEKKEAQGLAAIMETLNQQDADTAQDTVPLTLEEEDDALNEAEAQAENIEDFPLSTEDAETSEQDEANAVDTDIEIPKLGATPAKKKKKGFFSFGRNKTEAEADESVTTDLSDVAHDDNTTDSDEEESVEESLESNEQAENSDALSVQDIMDEIAADVTANLEQNQETPEPEAPSAPSRKETLQDIERQMKALRELHDAGLIATEIYLHKSRELARKING